MVTDLITNLTYNLTTLDIGEKARSCMHNGMISDTCLTKELCGTLNHYYIYAGLGLLALDLILGIVCFIYKKYHKEDRLKQMEFFWRVENLTKFGFMIFTIVVVYYNIGAL